MPEGRTHDEEVARYASLQDYLRVLRERWPLIAICAVLGAGIAFGLSAAQPKTYQTSAKLTPRQQAEDLTLIGESSGPISAPQAKAAELSVLATRESIAKRTADALGNQLGSEAIKSKVEIAIDVQTSLVLITATDDDAERAADIANEYAQQVEREARDVEREQLSESLAVVRRQRDDAGPRLPGDLTPTILKERFNRLQALKQIVRPVEIITNASAPSSPISPKPIRNSILGLLGGLFLGVVLAFARDAIDTRLKAPREMEDYFGLPRLGQMSEFAFARGINPSNGSKPMSPVDIEAARIIRTNLDHLSSEHDMRSVAITSSLPEEGKSTVAVALASVSAMAGKLTLLIECDLRQPVIAERLGLDPGPGLSDVLLGQAQPRDALQVVEIDPTQGGNGSRKRERKGSSSKSAGASAPLVTLTAGSAVPNPAELLASESFADMMDKVTKGYEVVILDTSPLLSVVDTRELLPVVDGVIVCARSYQTTRDQARAACEALDHFPVFIAGLVVTGVRHSDDDYYTYYHHYAKPREELAGSPASAEH